MIRQRYSVLHINPTVHVDGAGASYQMGVATDFTSMDGELMKFNFACDQGTVHVGDKISAAINVRQPTFLLDIIVEESEFEEPPNTMVEPAPFKLQEPPEIAEVVPQLDNLQFLVSRGLDFSQKDIRELAHRLIAVEKKCE
jgi:hypothetical protein